MNCYWVYIVQCKDGSYYTGVTNDVDKRVSEHNLGIFRTCYTFKRRPIKLVYAVGFNEVLEAIGHEKQIKRWSRAKKEALIQENWQELQILAQRPSERDSYIKRVALRDPQGDT